MLISGLTERQKEQLLKTEKMLFRNAMSFRLFFCLKIQLQTNKQKKNLLNLNFSERKILH